MPICKRCNHKWNWKETNKQTMSFNPAMTCPYCNGIQYQSKKSKMKTSFLSVIILLPLLLLALFQIPATIALSLIPLLALIVFILAPFLVELSNEERFPFDS